MLQIMFFVHLAVAIIWLLLQLIKPRFKYTKHLAYFLLCSHFVLLFLLAVLFVQDSFSFGYVAKYSSQNLSLIYKISAVWAGREGSLLLWSFLSLLFIVLFVKSSGTHKQIVGSCLYCALLLVNVFLANPFIESSKTLVAAGLNPALRNFWLTVHPPLLFAGYAAAMALFVQLVSTQKKGSESFNQLRRLGAVTLFLLTLGIASGGIWSYETLGWGGFWGWDPVENASLLPWLCAVLFMHQLYKSGDAELSLMARFSGMMICVSSLYAVFLTRSGLLADISVHSFAESPAAFAYLLLCAATLVLMILVLIRYNHKRQNVRSLLDIDLLILFLVFFVFSSLSFPIISALLFAKQIVVDRNVYNTLFLMAFFTGSAYTIWIRSKQITKSYLVVALLFSLVIGALLFLFVPGQLRGKAAIVFALCSILVSIDRKKIAYTLSHTGYNLFVIGIIFAFGLIPAKKIHFSKGDAHLIVNKKIAFEQQLHDKLLFTVDSKKREIAFEANGFAEPLIYRTLLFDIYLSPYSLVPREELAGTVWLETNHTAKKEDFEFSYLSHESKKELLVQNGEQSYTLLFEQEGSVQYLHDGRRVELRYVDDALKKALFWVEPKTIPENLFDLLLVEASIKPLINAVWLGILMVLLGMVLIFFKKGDK